MHGTTNIKYFHNIFTPNLKPDTLMP